MLLLVPTCPFLLSSISTCAIFTAVNVVCFCGHWRQVTRGWASSGCSRQPGRDWALNRPDRQGHCLTPCARSCSASGYGNVVIGSLERTEGRRGVRECAGGRISAPENGYIFWDVRLVYKPLWPSGRTVDFAGLIARRRDRFPLCGFLRRVAFLIFSLFARAYFPSA